VILLSIDDHRHRNASDLHQFPKRREWPFFENIKLSIINNARRGFFEEFAGNQRA
jgi:hypothetical protein